MNDFWGVLIGGKLRPAVSGQTFEVVNPKNGTVIANVAEGDAADISLAIDAAERAFPAWSSLPGAERGDILHRAAEILRRRLPELVDMEVDQIGRPKREMAAQLSRLPEWYAYFGAVARTHEDTVPPFSGKYLNYTRRVPLGVVGHVTPWNHPQLILTKKLAPAMAAGNTMVVKPSTPAKACRTLPANRAKRRWRDPEIWRKTPGGQGLRSWVLHRASGVYQC